MTSSELLRQADALSVWRRGDQRAPHKPLLLLLALARFADGQEGLAFSDVEEPLRRLLDDFGPPRKAHHPEYPFWRLQNDRLWTIDGTAGLVLRRSNSDPTLTSLRETDPVGRLAPEVAELLQREPALIHALAQRLLDAHFPASLHDEILEAVGLDATGLAVEGRSPLPRRRRDPAFREAVLRAYGYACAVCGFSARLGHTLVGVDAAHVKWHQAGGPDEVINGLALCALHHRLLDRGAYTITPAGEVGVAEEAHGGEEFERWLLAFHGRPVAQPVNPGYRVAEPFLGWHHREVFRGPARAA